MRLASSPRAVGCGVMCLGLAALLHVSTVSGAGDNAKLDAYKEKLKDLEASFKKTLGEALKEAEDQEKKADEAVKKLFDEQFKTKGKEKKDKLKADLDQARTERDRLAGIRKTYQFQQSVFKNTFGWDKLEDKLGAIVSAPGAILIDQLGLTKGESVIIDIVPTKSLAAKIGLKPNDILLKLGGQSVPNAATAFKKLVSEIKTDGPVEAVILRHGKQVTLSSGPTPEPLPKKGDGK